MEWSSRFGAEKEAKSPSAWLELQYIVEPCCYKVLMRAVCYRFTPKKAQAQDLLYIHVSTEHVLVGTK